MRLITCLWIDAENITVRYIIRLEWAQVIFQGNVYDCEIQRKDATYTKSSMQTIGYAYAETLSVLSLHDDKLNYPLGFYELGVNR